MPTRTSRAAGPLVLLLVSSIATASVAQPPNPPIATSSATVDRSSPRIPHRSTARIELATGALLGFGAVFLMLTGAFFAAPDVECDSGCDWDSSSLGFYLAAGSAAAASVSLVVLGATTDARRSRLLRAPDAPVLTLFLRAPTTERPFAIGLRGRF